MKTLFALILASLLASATAAETVLRPEGFAQRHAISLDGAGPFHQLVLPLAVYQGVSDPGLADLRVFNGRGEALPYALLRHEAPGESQRSEVAAPFFPLPMPARGNPGDGDLAVTVRQGKDGTLLAIRHSPAEPAASQLVRGIVVDGSKVRGSIRSLRLLTTESASAFHRYVIETSGDLQHWRLLKRDAQIVHLEHQGHRVDSDGAEWDGPAERYLRLFWVDPQRAPTVRSVLLGTVEASVRQPPRIWSGEVAPSAVQGGVYDYAWRGQLPLERLRINLPQVNTLAPLAIQHQTTGSGRHRHREPPRWQTLAQTVAYRLQTPQGEIRSADISLRGGVENHLRLAIDARGGAIGSLPPTIQIGFVPQVLVFLARGEGPFILAWGAAGVGRADLPPATLLPGYDAARPPGATPASLVPPERADAQPATPAAEVSSVPARWILWAVLAAGLLVLGAMARALARQLRQDSESKP